MVIKIGQNNPLYFALGIPSLLRLKDIALFGVFILMSLQEIYSSIYGNVASCFYVMLLSEAPSVP